MARRPAIRSNIFPIELDEIIPKLADVNASLMTEADELIKKAEELPNIIDNEGVAREFVYIIERLAIQRKQIRDARLTDGRPFTEAAKIVRNWFGETENKIKAIDKKLTATLSEYVSYTQDTPMVPMKWEVKNFNLNSLDIEGLRLYFTKNAIERAIKSHMKENGPNCLSGVEYQQVVDK